MRSAPIATATPQAPCLPPTTILVTDLNGTFVSVDRELDTDTWCSAEENTRQRQRAAESGFLRLPLQPEEQGVPIHYCGHLKKKRGGKWITRFFVLCETNIPFFTRRGMKNR